MQRDLDEKLLHLCDELLCHCNAKVVVAAFLKYAQKRRVSVYNLVLDDTFIAIVSDGQRKGHAWLVDPFYDGAEFRKFSETAEAGANEDDFVGRTCDTLTHFSFIDSQESLPLILQLASLPSSSRHKSDRQRLLLFDLMIHSQSEEFGLGDQGQVGIDQFVNQHSCNGICRALGLEPFNPRELSISRYDSASSDSEISGSDSGSEATIKQEKKGKARKPLVVYEESSE
ncbi:kinase-like domain-containing protein [Coprinopsis sp. MPI-PUGE-AT-0042]|nr:kinase-like domain-containing protein [Coprinopsis sp. MPI-PUGE-AT-0042]